MEARSFYVYILASKIGGALRAWKIRLIEELNPNWDDLYSGIAGS